MECGTISFGLEIFEFFCMEYLDQDNWLVSIRINSLYVHELRSRTALALEI